MDEREKRAAFCGGKAALVLFSDDNEADGNLDK